MPAPDPAPGSVTGDGPPAALPGPPRSAGGVAFDLLFGAVLPAVCLVFDPLVFRTGGLPIGPLLGGYAVLGYTAVAVGLASLVVWLLIRRPAGLLAGLLAGGAAFALGLGVVLLPFSLMGLALLIGVLGFTPLVTGVVFLRNAGRAWRVARSGGAARGWAAAGFVAACGLPWLAQAGVDREVQRAAGLLGSGEPAEAEAGVRAFERLGPLGRTTPAAFDGLAWEYEREADAGRRGRLADVYRRLTGEVIEHRLLVLRD